MKSDDIVPLLVFVVAFFAVCYFSIAASKKKRGSNGSELATGLLPTSIMQRLRASTVTMVLIACSIGMAILSGLGNSREALAPFLFVGAHGFGDVLDGQVWRLVTPIFIHFGPLHLLFNMMWLWDLGPAIERRNGSSFLLGFVALVGVTSNLGQYVMTHHPLFGGMSGVVYGLLGYIWIQGRMNPRFGLMLTPQTVYMMLVWFVLCWVGVLGAIANWAHTLGLLAGATWGYVDAVSARSK